VNDTVTKEDVAAFLQKNTHAKEERIRATPAARRIARENNLDLIDAGSGPHGRVQERDMLSLVQDAPISERHLEDKTVPLKGMRKVIAEKMVQSYQNIPHIHLTVSVDMTNFSSLRATLNAKKQQPGDGKISVTSLMVFLISRVLEKHPWLNSSLVGEEIQFSAQVNIGVAVALSEGLIVPVIKTANRKDIYRIIQEMNELTYKARGNELKPEDVSNGTFTITNLGPYGIEQFTAIINPGQCAILAVGAAKEEIVPINGKPQVHTMMKMTMAADHRVVDGAIAALFLGELKTVLENPGYLLFK
jgi:pyruvate dehydrogenase E2 component (dihydrolipoamide acetyltransferase)